MIGYRSHTRALAASSRVTASPRVLALSDGSFAAVGDEYIAGDGTRGTRVYGPRLARLVVELGTDGWTVRQWPV